MQNEEQNAKSEPANKAELSIFGADVGSQPRYRLGHAVWWPILVGALAGVLLRFVFMGKNGLPFSPMLGSFIYGAPIVSAVVSTWLCGEQRRDKLLTCIGVSMASACLVVLGALLVAIEGWICAIVIFPVFAIVGAITGCVMWGIYRVVGGIQAKRAVYSITALPLLLGMLEPSLVVAPQEFHTTERTVFIAAPPNVVWKHVADTPTIEDAQFADSYSHRVGAPVPLEAHSVAKPNGQWERHMRWTKGVHFYGDVNDWQPGRSMAWRYRFTPDAFPVGALDEHVTLKSDYFELIDGSYHLVPEGDGTVLTEITHWRISTKFNLYSRFLGEAMIGDTLDHILRVMKERSEQEMLAKS